jgi:mTERF
MLKNFLHKSLLSNSVNSLYNLIPYRGFSAKVAFNTQKQGEAAENLKGDSIGDIAASLKSYSSLSEFVERGSDSVFEEAYKNVDLKTEIAPALQKYKELGFNKKQLAFLMKRRTDSLTVSPAKERLDIITLTQYVQEKYKLDEKGVRSLVLKAPALFKLSPAQLESNINYLKNTFGFNHVTNFH